MNRIACFVGALALLTAFAMPAHADSDQGVFEAPMMDDVGVVDGSEGKIGEFGAYKVEVPLEPVAEDTDFKICLRSAPSLGGAGADVFVQTVTVLLGENELKAEGDLLAGSLWRPAFRVFTGGTADTCDGDVVYESGMTVFEEI